MPRSALLFFTVAVLMVSSGLARAENHVQAAIKTATTPAHRMESGKKNWWQQRHEDKLALAKQGSWELVFRVRSSRVPRTHTVMLQIPVLSMDNGMGPRHKAEDDNGG